MENAIWGERLLTATDIAKDYQTEKEVRKASGRKELRCPDPECQHPIIRYCHGEIKEAFFAHLNNKCCDYADFDKTNTQVMRNVKRHIYEHFKAAGYKVRLEVKVLEHHYTHLLFDMYDGENIESNNYPETYTEIASLADLTFEGNELTITGFSARYEIWLNKKHKAFSKRVVQLEEESRQRREGMALQVQEKNRIYCEQQKLIEKALQTAPSNPVTHRTPSLPNMTYEQCKQEVLPLIDQQQIQARDSLGKRWVKCEKCGIIDTDDKFVSYGGQGRLNLGTCNNCSGSKRRTSQ